MTRIAIVGARGIGAVHARVLTALGAEVVALAASRPATAAETAARLERELGIRPRPFADVGLMLEACAPDAVVIASPPARHAEHLAAALGHDVPALCEKPLFWPARGEPVSALRAFAAELGARQGRWMLNTANAGFVRAVRARLTEPRGDFAFEFHTRGLATGEAIAVDLVPHAFALLHALDPDALDADAFDAGAGAPEDLRVRAEEHRFRAEFRWLGRRVTLDLCADPAGAKHLAFAVGRQRFRRVQEGTGPTYRVFLAEERSAASGGARVEVEDPFVALARSFLARVGGTRDSWHETTRAGLANLAAARVLLLETPRSALREGEEPACLRA